MAMAIFARCAGGASGTKLMNSYGLVMRIKNIIKITWVNVAILCLILSVLLICDSFFMYKKTVSRSSQPSKENNWSDAIHQPDPLLGWRLKSDMRVRHARKGEYPFSVIYTTDNKARRTIRTNSMSNDKRILFFGDSFTFGYGVNNEDVFVQEVANNIDNYSVYNYGVNGYGIAQMYQSLLIEFENLSKGDVVVFAPISRDFGRTYKSSMNRSILRMKIRNSPIPAITAFPRFDNSSPFLLSTYSYTNFDRVRYIFYSSIIGRRIKSFINRFVSEKEEWHQESASLIIKAHELCQKKSVKFIVMLLPRYEREKNIFDADFSEQFIKNGVVMFNSKLYFNWTIFSEEYFLKPNGHYNAKGHSAIASSFVDQFQSVFGHSE